MTTREIDVAIIGAGTAGLAAYRSAKAAGANTVIIEGGEHGTTCARVGCMPSKLLIAAADAADAVGKARGFGVHVDGGVRIDGAEVMDRVRRERDRFVGFVLRDVKDIPDADRILGHAAFIDDHTLAVGDHTLVRCKSIVIATGSRATYPDSFKALGNRLIISDDVFDWHELPRSVAVMGPGIVGLELGQALHRLGVRVVLLGRGGRVGPIGDPDILAYAIAAFNREFPLEPDAKVESMERDGDRVAIRRKGKDGKSTVEHFDFVLAATGRAPNVSGIGLERTSIQLDAKGVPSFDPVTTQTGSAKGTCPIFIAGDASNFIPLLHEAADEGRTAGRNAARLALGSAVTPVRRRVPIGIVFTDPQIAIVGGGYNKLPEHSFATGQASFEDQGRARIMYCNTGLLNVYADLATGRFLGAEMLVPAAEHLAHLLALALLNKMTIAQMLEMPFYHPVIEEGLRTALRRLQNKLRETPMPIARAAEAPNMPKRVREAENV